MILYDLRAGYKMALHMGSACIIWDRRRSWTAGQVEDLHWDVLHCYLVVG